MAAVHVVLPRVAGTVTAKSGATLTLLRRDGTNATVHTGSGTTYRVPGDDTATLADITVGMIVVAVGSERSDGSLDAEIVASGLGLAFHGRGKAGGLGPWDATPKASPSSGTNSSTS